MQLPAEIQYQQLFKKIRLKLNHLFKCKEEGKLNVREIQKWFYSAVGLPTSEDRIKAHVKNAQIDVVVRENVGLKVSLKGLKTLSRKQPSQATLRHMTKLYDMGTSKIKNKEIQKLLKFEIAKSLLNKALDKTYSNL